MRTLTLAGLPARVLSILLSVALVLPAFLALGVVGAAPAAAAAGLTLTKNAPNSVLAGETVSYTLTATNPKPPADQALFNVSFRDVLPRGIRFVEGSTDPVAFEQPTPTTVVDPVTGAQTVIWDNVTDLQPGSSASLTFSATVDTSIWAVGSTFTNTANAYGSEDPRQVPKFNADGTPITSPAITSAAASGQPTLVTPIKITKSEPSPEGELLRGVHDQVTTYTLKVKNNEYFDTNGTVLVDYVPASLEFLGCGGVDNTRLDPITGLPTPEYPGSGPLGGFPPPADCVFPDQVSTVTNPTVGGTTLTGVYTRLQWTLGNFVAGAERTITYAAGVPLRANTTNWTARPDGEPTPGSGLQAANLDNNTGDPTRETLGELSATNTARIEGTYTGPFAPGATNPVSDQTSVTVTLEDVAVQKTVDNPLFISNGIATFTLKVRVSEYVDGTGILLTDVLPNGYCPLSSTTNFVTGASLDCAPRAGADPTGAAYASVTQNAGTGEFEIVFTDLAVDANDDATVTFQAKMRETYTGGSLEGTPTTSGDSFTNKVELRGTTTGVAGTGQPGTEQVLDESEATQTTEGLTIRKGVQPRVVPQDCSDAANNPYVRTEEIEAPGFDRRTVAFRKGDRVCFQLDVQFADTSAARNVVVTDVVPAGTAYEAGSQSVAGLSAAAVVFNTAAAESGAEFPTWQLGFPTEDGTVVFQGTTVTIRFSVLVTDAAPANTVDITGNLMKMKSESSSGQVTSYRDQVPFGIIPAPPVPIVKGIAAINGTAINQPPAAINPPTTGVDGRTVVEGDKVRFRVDVTNGGSDANFNNFTIRGLQVWDVLPSGIRCAQISNISAVSSSDGAPVGTCTDPGEDGHPTFTGRDALSAIVWNFRTGLEGDADQLVAGETRTLTYDMDVPTPSSILQRYTNTAYVRSFDGFTNLFDVVGQYFPSDNVDTTVDPGDYSGPPSRDPSDVVLPNAGFTKELVSTGLDEQNNPTPPNGNVAVNGETVSYRIRLDIPARTSVFNGSVADPLAAANFIRDSASFVFYPDATSTTPGTPPAGVIFNSANTGSLVLNNAGSTYTNSSDTVQRFEILIQARISPTTGAGNKNNTATFRRTPTVANSDAINRTAGATATVRIPVPNIDKENDAAGEVRAGDTVTYTLTATNQVGAPPLHDTVVVDCLPAGLEFLAYGTPTQGTTVAAIPGDGVLCGTAFTQLQWNVGTVLGGTTTPNAPDPGEVLTYTVTVDPAAAGSVTYTNTATLTGSTLPNGSNTPAVERVIGDSDSDEVRVAVGALIKTVTPERATIGERVTYRVSIDIPLRVNFYDAVVLDDLPAGIDVDTVELESATCEFAGGGECEVQGAPMEPFGLPDGATRIGWYAGDVLSSDQRRTVTFTYTAVVAGSGGTTPQRGDSIINFARSGWFFTDDPDRPIPGADTTFDQVGDGDTATVTVLEPQVTVQKAVTDQTPEPGTPITYSVDITNGSADPAANNSTAYGLQVVDTVPDGVVVTLPLTDGGVFAADATPEDGGGTITWTIDQLAPGATVSRSYGALLADSPYLDGGSLENTVRPTLYTSRPAGDPEGVGRTYACPDCDEATAIVTPDLPKLAVTKTAVGGAPAYIGESYPWRVTITNTGRGTAYDVLVSDTLPPNWRYTSGTSIVTRPGGTPLPEAPSDSAISGDGQSLTWGTAADPVVDIAPGQILTVDFEATPNTFVVANPQVGATVPHVNSAGATARDGAGFPGFNTPETAYADSDDAQTRIDSADLVIEKSHSVPPEPADPDPAAGAPFDWYLDVANAGTDQAVGAFTVRDDLPEGITPNGLPTGEGWTCTVPDADGVFTCQRTDPDETLDATKVFPRITVPVITDPSTPDGTVYTNAASVSARTYDPQLDNNETTDPVTLRTEADVTVVKTLTDGPIVAGENATYTLDVANDGPSTALGTITVTDTLPPGSTLESVDGGTDWDCPVPTATAGVLECTYLANGGDMLPGTTEQITVVVGIPSGQTADVVNSVIVDSPTTPDPDLTNNEDEVTSTPDTSADLAITKISVPADEDLVAGDPGTYRFTVENLGPSDAADVQVTDPLPAGLTYTGFTSVTGDWACSAVGQDVTCDLLDDPLAANASAVVEISVAIASDVSGPIENTATVSTSTDDPNELNDSSTDLSDSRAEADVFITKTDSPDPVIAGEQITYTLIVGNKGPSDAQGPIVVTDELPEGTSFVSVTPDSTGSPWACAEDAGVITCERSATLQAKDDGEGDPITVVVDVGPSAGPGTISNTATVESRTTPEVDNGNNSATAETEVIDRAEISLAKETTGAATITAGADTGTEFTITVTNDGRSTADTLVVTDTLPTGLTPVSASGDGWTCDDPIVGQVITCTRPDLAPGTSDIVVIARADASVLDGTTLTNAASVTTTTPGDDPENNDGTAAVLVEASADMTLTKTHPEAAVLAGDPVTFTLTATNNGPSDAQPVLTITDTLPAGFVFLTGAAPWECTAELPTDTGQLVTCELVGAAALPPRSEAPALELTARVSPAVDPDTYVNTAEVTSPTTDPDPGPDSNGATDPVEVSTQAALTITKSHEGPVRIGDDLAFTLTVTNSGPSQARDVVIVDELPTGLTYVSAVVDSPAGSCTQADATIECVLDAPLEPEGVATIVVTTTVEVAAYPSVTNPATVTSSTPDPDESDNSATDEVLVPPMVDLQVTKSHTDTFLVGESASYVIDVVNLGPTEDPGPIVVTDALPLGLTYVSAQGTGWTCTAQDEQVTCTLPAGLAVDGSAQIALTVLVGPEAAPEVVNTALVSTESEDVDLSNNTSIDPTDVTPLSQLGLVKELVSQEDSEVVFLLTATNLGPNATSTALVLTDPLPPQLTLVSAEGDGWECSNVAPTVTCLYQGVLAVDESSAVTLTAEVDADPEQEITNVATLSGGSPTSVEVTDSASFTTPPEAATGGSGDGSGDGTDGGLAETGADLGLILWAVLLLGTGWAGVWTSRRRMGRVAG